MKILKEHTTFQGKTQFWSHDSTSTKTEMKFSTFIPDGEVKGCLIWLSGLTCTDENFISKSGAQKFLAQENLMVICPDTSPRGLSLPGEHEAYDFGSGAGFYVDATTKDYASHYNMYSYVTDELYKVIQDHFKVSNISISGHSMGGHGALVIGLRNPKKFKSVSAFSPIVHPSVVPWGIKAFSGYLGEEKDKWHQYDTCELMKAGHTHPANILISQGTKDEFLEKQLLTDHFVTQAKAVGQSQEVQYCEGYDHSYYFIATFIESHISHHAKYLKVRQ